MENPFFKLQEILTLNNTEMPKPKVISKACKDNGFTIGQKRVAQLLSGEKSGQIDELNAIADFFGFEIEPINFKLKK